MQRRLTVGAEDEYTQAGLGEDEDPGRQPPLPLWPDGAGQGPARPSHSVNTHSPDGPQGRSESLEGVVSKRGGVSLLVLLVCQCESTATPLVLTATFPVIFSTVPEHSLHVIHKLLLGTV